MSILWSPRHAVPWRGAGSEVREVSCLQIVNALECNAREFEYYQWDGIARVYTGWGWGVNRIVFMYVFCKEYGYELELVRDQR